jgi:hypothetical protein
LTTHEFVVALVAAIIVEVIARVFAEPLVRLAARKLPLDARERYEAEWLAILDSIAGLRVRRLRYALSLLRGSGRLSRVLSGSSERMRWRIRLELRTTLVRLLQASFAVDVAALALDFAGRRDLLYWVLIGVAAAMTGPSLCFVVMWRVQHWWSFRTSR